MKNKKLIRLTESDLHRIVKESVNKILREDFLSDLVIKAFDRKGNELTLGDVVIWKNLHSKLHACSLLSSGVNRYIIPKVFQEKILVQTQLPFKMQIAALANDSTFVSQP